MSQTKAEEEDVVPATAAAVVAVIVGSCVVVVVAPAAVAAAVVAAMPTECRSGADEDGAVDYRRRAGDLSTKKKNCDARIIRSLVEAAVDSAFSASVDFVRVEAVVVASFFAN